MTPRAQELFNLAKELERIRTPNRYQPDYLAIARRLASALDAMEQDLSKGFIREHLVPSSVDAFQGRKPSNASK